MFAIVPLAALCLLLLPMALQAEDGAQLRSRLFRCMVERGPYEYMFAHQEDPNVATIQLFGKTFSQYLAGTRGALHYSNFNECLHLMQYPDASANRIKWGRLDALQRYAGIQPLFRKQIFMRINPAILDWGLKQLLPQPDEKLDGHTYQEIYNVVLQRFARTMTLTYLHLKFKTDYNQEQLAYMQAFFGQRNFDPGKYLNNRYGHLYRELETSLQRDWGELEVSEAMGFWLRRGLNGTDARAWQMVRIAMLRFDGDWLRTTEARFR